jgi:ferric-dicitrate binding protein FerR (iron transport regulator)
MDRFEKAVPEFLDGELDPVSAGELARLMADDPEKLRLVRDMVRVDKLLGLDVSEAKGAEFTRAVLAEIRKDEQTFAEHVREEIETAGKPRTRRRALIWTSVLALAASLAVVAGLFVTGHWHRQPAVFPAGLRVVAVDGGHAAVDGVTLQPGAILAPGCTVVTEAGCLVSAESPDGSTLDINEHTDLQLSKEGWPDQLVLRRGAMYCRVTPRENRTRPLAVRTPAGHRAVVVSTVFELAAAGARTELLVERGVVRLETSKQHLQVPPLGRIVVTGDVLSKPERVMIFDIARWKYRQDRDALAADLSRCRDGRVLFRDDFEKGLGHWDRVTMKTAGDRWVREPEPTATDLRGVRVESAVVRGKPSQVLVVDQRGMKDKYPCAALVRPVPARAYSMEFDTKWKTLGLASFVVSTGRKPGKVLYNDESLKTRLAAGAAKGEWYRNRLELLFKVDAAGEGYVEVRNYVNGDLVRHHIVYPDSLAMGCVTRKGCVLIDNVVIREMVRTSP